jgi:sugar porter (SP) family MFS transporter
VGAFGALACTFLGDKYGRRLTLWVACLFNALGAILMCSAFSFGQFIVSRIVLGFGTGGVIATTSVWQSELSKASSRGSHVSAFGIFCGIGLVLALWIDFGCSYASSSFSWRFPLAFPIFFSAIAMPTIFTLPESPRWLMKVGRNIEAAEILELLHEDPETVEKELRDIRVSLDLSGNSSLKSLLEMGTQRVFHRVLIGCTAQMMLQLTGVNSITYYASSLFEVQLGFTAKTAEVLAAASQFSIILGSTICSFTVDRFGRRSLMMFSASSMSICFACLAGLVSHPSDKAGLKAAVFFVFLYYVCYTLGWLGIPFLYASEIAPARQRAQICGISTAVSWLFNFLVAEVTPVAFTDIGWKYFIVYCALNAAWVPTIYFFFPETKGMLPSKSLHLGTKWSLC